MPTARQNQRSHDRGRGGARYPAAEAQRRGRLSQQGVDHGHQESWQDFGWSCYTWGSSVAVSACGYGGPLHSDDGADAVEI